MKIYFIKSLPALFLTALIVAVLVGLDFFKPMPEKKPYQAKKLKVFVEPTKLKTTQLYVFSQGEVVPTQQLELKSQVEGRITFVATNMVNGGRLSKGQTLIKVDDRDYKLAVIQREAKVAQSKQQLSKVEAQANVAKLELDTLARDNVNELALYLPQLEHAKAELKAAEALLQQAKLALSRTTLHAPFDGIVKEESVNIGQMIGRNTKLATLYASKMMEVKLALNNQQLAILDIPIDFYQRTYEDGLPIELYTEIGAERLSWPARLMRTAGAFDPRTRTLSVIAQVEQQANLPMLLPGLFVNAKLPGKKVKRATELARTSLRPNNKIWYVDDDNLLQVTSITPVHRTSEYVVVKGLAKGTKVVTSALVAPIPGVKVKALKQTQSNDDVVVIGKSQRAVKNKGEALNTAWQTPKHEASEKRIKRQTSKENIKTGAQ